MTTAVSAVEMGARQREISVSEFFTKNRHLLGFDNPRKALLTCVKEAVDNALDASEEAGILPEVRSSRSCSTGRRSIACA
jgi:DNA topoisomerase-6 subunit B